jgi:hypothetical protein
MAFHKLIHWLLFIDRRDIKSSAIALTTPAGRLSTPPPFFFFFALLRLQMRMGWTTAHEASYMTPDTPGFESIALAHRFLYVSNS